MATIIAHMIGSVTYFIGIVLLSNTVKQVYINEILFQSGITTKGRVIAKTKQPFCGSNKLQRHYLIIEYVIHSAQSLICNIKLKVSSNLYNQHITNDYIAIIYAKQDNKYYHNTKSQMDQQLKAITLYSNIALSMIIISIYPFMYFLSGHFTLIPFTIFVVLCVIQLPHHLHSCDIIIGHGATAGYNKRHCIKRMANRDDLRSFGIDYRVEAEDNYYVEQDKQMAANMYYHQHEDNTSSEVDIDRESSQTTSTHMSTPVGCHNDNGSPSIQITTNTSNSASTGSNGPIIDRPQEAIAILYESYVETPTPEQDDHENVGSGCGSGSGSVIDIDVNQTQDQDEFVMVFN